jgi:hypothetical protein
VENKKQKKEVQTKKYGFISMKKRPGSKKNSHNINKKRIAMK